MTEVPLIIPDWPLPAGLRAVQTTRGGGVSQGPWDSLNLALHTGDAPETVQENRERLARALGLARIPTWPRQVHGAVVVEARSTIDAVEADAVVGRGPGEVCSVQTADCLPVLFCSHDGVVVAAAHAGWRGLAAGVLEATLRTMARPPTEVMAWLGPAIGPAAFRVGAGDRWFADIYRLARLRLERAGVADIHGGGRCTFHESDRFFSYRRDGVCGRMATLIWRIA